MSYKTTSRGTLANRPLPNANNVYGTYYFCTDDSTYYYSTGEKWEAKPLDKTDLSPDTAAQVICGIASDGSINPIKLDSSGNIKVASGSGGSGDFVNISGEVLEAGIAQEIAPANPARKYLFFQNISDTDMYLGIGEPASTSSIPIAGYGGGIGFDTFVPTNAISVWCWGANKSFVAFEA